MSKKFIQLFIFSIAVISIFAVAIVFLNREQLEQHVTKINGHYWKVELVSNPEAVKQGLSGRKFMAKDSGMLFVFDQAMPISFWMKNMHFPLDIIWINAGRVTRIDENLPPEGEKPVNIYPSYSNITHVLEINAGEAKTYNLKIGDEVIIK